jgi:hypothetical protein
MEEETDLLTNNGSPVTRAVIIGGALPAVRNL